MQTIFIHIYNNKKSMQTNCRQFASNFPNQAHSNFTTRYPSDHFYNLRDFLKRCRLRPHAKQTIIFAFAKFSQKICGGCGDSPHIFLSTHGKLLLTKI